jgi:hypothetical protein
MKVIFSPTNFLNNHKFELCGQEQVIRDRRKGKKGKGMKAKGMKAKGMKAKEMEGRGERRGKRG